MTRGSLLSWLPPLGSLLLLGACVEPPARADAQADAHPAKQESAPEAVTPTPTPPATPPAPTQPAFAPVKPTPAGPLTAEEERLIAADINTLSTEEKRLRAYAQRKKIMQNPDSEAAKALLEAQQALMAGEIPPPPSTQPPSDSGPKRDANGGLILELPPHLRDQQKK
ncbi:MAG: hypothetical protein KC457_11850 [Myxococcales bacterium]|nr:hypothetical protein [Myxococcales bacterium]